MFVWNKTVPELMVENLEISLDFWVRLIGFQVAYDRPKEKFSYLDLGGAQIMLEQRNALDNQWITGAHEYPLGRGTNLQIEVDEVAPILQRLELAGWPLFRECEDAWYQAGPIEVGQRQFLVQDPDGYLIRLVQDIGERTLGPTN
jgi:catechol 2,3-dioxygenase-like lactoylglutathione lyase family enzyme